MNNLDLIKIESHSRSIYHKGSYSLREFIESSVLQVLRHAIFHLLVLQITRLWYLVFIRVSVGNYIWFCPNFLFFFFCGEVIWANSTSLFLTFLWKKNNLFRLNTLAGCSNATRELRSTLTFSQTPVTLLFIHGICYCFRVYYWAMILKRMAYICFICL